MSKVALDKLATLVEDLQKQVAALTERLASLEQPAANGNGAQLVVDAAAPAATAAPEPAAAAAPAAAPPPPAEEITPELLLAISAAVAAYLGERAHVRAVRLIGTTRWSQEGRVSIQASHYLNRG